jgi:hypothetical protein
MPTPLPPEGTLLVLTNIGIPLFSTRNAKQTLTPVAAAAVIRRTINMEAVNLSLPTATKYDTSITAHDVAPPAFDAVWPGLQVVIDCIAELQYPVGGTPSRTVVTGSEVTLGSFVRFRPQLTMIVTGLSVAADEWAAGQEWTLTATEV